MYLSRTLEPFLDKVIEQFPVLLVTGPRQVGKTTMLKNVGGDNFAYVTLDDPTVAQMAKEEPELFLQRFKPPVIIDEIQYAPELLPYIKIHVDEQRKNGQFILTGSQQFHLMKGVTESLAGRVAIVNMLGLSLKEARSKPDGRVSFVPTSECLDEFMGDYKQLDLMEVFDIIWRGSFPAIAANEIDRDIFYDSYIQTYLQRDVRDLLNVGDIGVFLKFLRAAAARTGQLMNLSDMARDVGITSATAKSWLSILEASGIIYLLEPYYNNLTSRMVKTPKLYFLDTGLCAYLTQWSTSKSLEAGAMSGAMLETFMFAEILKSYWHNGKRAPFYYYRDKDKKEIDLLIFKDDIIYPLEFKKTASPKKDDVKSFHLLDKFGKSIGEGGVLCLCKTLLPITSSVNAIPVGVLG